MHLIYCSHCTTTYSYTAEPSELHEFSEEKEPLLSVINGDLHHTHKQGNDQLFVPPLFLVYCYKMLFLKYFGCPQVLVMTSIGSRVFDKVLWRAIWRKRILIGSNE